MTKFPCQPDCPIPNAKGFSEPEGEGTLGVLILGEALGDAEAHDGKPFRPYAPAGAVLERAIKRAGFVRPQFKLWNIVGCQPPKNFLEHAPWEGAAISHCRPFLDAVIERMRPGCLLALGNVPLKATTGMTGEYRSVTYLRGYVLPSVHGIPVVASFHPSFLRRGAMPLLSVLMHDIKLAVQVAKERLALSDLNDPNDPVIPDGYILHPSVDDAWSWLYRLKDNPQVLLMYDIETPRSSSTSEDETDELGDSEILSIQFSTGRGQGIFMPWQEPYITIAKAALALPNEKAGQNNWRFDDPLLRAHGAHIAGCVHDIRWAWHHLQPELLANLQFIASFYGWPFPWKHLHAAQPEAYGLFDVDVLHYIAPALFEDLRKRGVWRGYEQHVLKFEPIICRMAERGMPVDPALHAAAYVTIEQQKGELWGRMQALVPDDVRPIHPKLGYKKPPKGATLNLTTSHAGKNGKWIRRFFPSDIEGVQERWCKLLDWVPSSGENGGLIRYMKFKKHPVPKDYKSGEETTIDRELVRLWKKMKDPLYKALFEYRDAQHMLSDHMENWRPGPDGRVHPQIYIASTGQLAARRPNTMNAPKHLVSKSGRAKPLNDLFRSIVVAKPGHTFLAFDYKSFHAQTLAFEAQDPDYLRLAKLDIHSYLAAFLVRAFSPAELDGLLSLSDEDLKEKLTWVKKNHKAVRDQQAKEAILGYGFGLQARGLYERNRENFENIAAAVRVMDMLNARFPRTAKFRTTIRQKAHQQGYLISKGGSIRWFWEVFKWDSAKGQYVPGEDSEAAIAFLPANDAFGHKKDAVIRLDKQEWLDRAQYINDVHDEVFFECPNTLVDIAIPTIASELERPSEVLVDPVVAPGGLAVEVSVSVGKSWNKMEDVQWRNQFQTTLPRT